MHNPTDHPPKHQSLARFAVSQTATSHDQYDDDDEHGVTIGAPSRSSYVRFRIPAMMTVQLVTLKPEGSFNKELYLAVPDIAEVLPDDIAQFDLFRFVDRNGREGIWPISLTSPSRSLDLGAVKAASAAWVRIFWRRTATGGHRSFIRAANPTVFGEPVWSARSDDELIDAGFAGRMIEDVDHPVVQHLLGVE